MFIDVIARFHFRVLRNRLFNDSHVGAQRAARSPNQDIRLARLSRLDQARLTDLCHRGVTRDVTHLPGDVFLLSIGKISGHDQLLPSPRRQDNVLR